MKFYPGAVIGVGEIDYLINHRLQKDELTQEEEELLKTYGPTLGYVKRDWKGRCPETPLRDTYYTLRYGTPSETQEKNDHFEEDLKRAQGLGWIILDTSDRSIDVVVLTGRGEYLAEAYV